MARNWKEQGCEFSRKKTALLNAIRTGIILVLLPIHGENEAFHLYKSGRKIFHIHIWALPELSNIQEGMHCLQNPSLQLTVMV